MGKQRLHKHTHAVFRNTTVFVQPLSHVRLLVTPWTVVCQVSLSFTISLLLLKSMSIELVMLTISSSASPFFCLQCLPAFRVFSNELVLCIRWPKY